MRTVPTLSRLTDAEAPRPVFNDTGDWSGSTDTSLWEALDSLSTVTSPAPSDTIGIALTPAGFAIVGKSSEHAADKIATIRS
jgi:hypothetical protein